MTTAPIASPQHGPPPGAVAEGEPEDGRLLRAGVGLVVLSLFLERFERVESDGTYPLLPIPDVFFVAATGVLAAAVVHELARGRLALRPPGAGGRAVIAFVAVLGAVSLLAVVTQPELASGVQSLKTFAHLAFLAGAALLLAQALRRRRWVEQALGWYFALAVSVSALAVAQALDQNLLHTGASEWLRLVSRTSSGFVRPCGVFSEPAYLGYAALWGVVSGALVVAPRRPRSALAGMVVLAAAFSLAAAAGPVLVAGVVALYAAVRWRHRLVSPRGLAWAAALAAAAGAVALATPVGGIVSERFTLIATGRDPSEELRTELNEGSIEVWRLAPATGVGLGNTRRHLSEFVDVSYLPPGATFAFNSANAYVNLLGETGPLGAAALVALLLVLLLLRRRGAPPADEATRILLLAAAVGFLSVNGLLLTPFWFVVGLRIATAWEPDA